MGKSSEVKSTFEFKKVTRGGKKHFANEEGSKVTGALYFSDKTLKEVGADENSELEVVVRVRRTS